VPASWRSWRAFEAHCGICCHTCQHHVPCAASGAALAEVDESRFKQSGHPAQAWPSEVDAEGISNVAEGGDGLPAARALPAREINVVCEGETAEDLMLGYKRGGWEICWLDRKDPFIRYPWNANYVLLPENRFEDFKEDHRVAAARPEPSMGMDRSVQSNGKPSRFRTLRPTHELASNCNLQRWWRPD